MALGDPAARQYYSPRELAARMGVSQATITRRIQDGTIPAVRLGRRLLIPADWQPGHPNK